MIIPCFQQGRFLHEAITSALAQEGIDLEVIVVDDGSTDSTEDVARRYRNARYERQENAGVAAARNHGFGLSRGAFVVFLDADDRLWPGALATSTRLMQASPDCAFVYGRHRFVDGDGRALPTPPQPTDAAAFYRLSLRGESHPVHTPGQVLYRREVIQSVGGFDSRFDGCEDLHLNLRISQTARACFNDRIVLDHRMHDASARTRSARMLKQALAVQKTQRDFVRKHDQYADDYRVGINTARTYFGRHLAADIRRKALPDPYGALRDLGALVRHDPRGAPGHLGRVLRVVAAARLRRRRTAT